MNISKLLLKLFLLSIVAGSYSARAESLSEFLTFESQVYDGMSTFVNTDFLPDPDGKCSSENQNVSYSLSVSLKNNSDQGYLIYAVPGGNFSSGVETQFNNFSVSKGVLTFRGLASKVQYGFIVQNPNGERNRIFGMANICGLTSPPLKINFATRVIRITIDRWGIEPVDHVTGYTDNTPHNASGNSGNSSVDPAISFPPEGRAGSFHDGYVPREVHDLVVSMLLTSYPKSAVGILETATTYSFDTGYSYVITFKGETGEGYISIDKPTRPGAEEVLEVLSAINVYGSDTTSVHLYTINPITNKVDVRVQQMKKDGSYAYNLDFDLSGGRPRRGSLVGIDFSIELNRDSDRYQSGWGYRPQYGQSLPERIREIVNMSLSRRDLGYDGEGTVSFKSLKEIENNQCEVQLSWELPGNTDELKVHLIVDGVATGSVGLLSLESGFLLARCKDFDFYPQTGKLYSVKVSLILGDLPVLISNVKELQMRSQLEQTSRRLFNIPVNQPYRSYKHSSVLMKKAEGGICNVKSGASGVRTDVRIHQFLEESAYLVGGIGECWL